LGEGEGEIGVAKTLVTMAELQRLILTEIRTHDGCGDVTDVSIYHVTDDQSECNWSVGVVGCGSATPAANRLTGLSRRPRFQPSTYLGIATSTFGCWGEKNEKDFADVKSRLPGRLAIHREQSDEADGAIRRGIVSPVLVVGRWCASGRLGRLGASLQATLCIRGNVNVRSGRLGVCGPG
jgi:hypothetical protein